MARIAEPRAAAEPISADQKERYASILRAAARLGSEHGHERMQMNDVAKEAGVAIATLYRYFPSKNDLFLALLRSQVDTFTAATERMDLPPSEAAAKTLIEASNRLLQRPLLATAMLQANNYAQLISGREGSDVTNAFHVVLFRALGVDEPTANDQRMVRLLEQAWYGVLISVLNSVITPDECADDLRLVCELLLGPTYDNPQDSPQKQE